MAGLIILAIAGLAAITLLFACLNGFSQALRHRKASGVFVTVKDERRRKPRGPSKTLVAFPPARPVREHPQRISGSTVAMMSLVIALGARGASGDIHPSFKGERSRVPGVQPLRNS